MCFVRGLCARPCVLAGPECTRQLKVLRPGPAQYLRAVQSLYVFQALTCSVLGEVALSPSDFGPILGLPVRWSSKVFQNRTAARANDHQHPCLLSRWRCAERMQVLPGASTVELPKGEPLVTPAFVGYLGAHSSIQISSKRWLAMSSVRHRL